MCTDLALEWSTCKTGQQAHQLAWSDIIQVYHLFAALCDIYGDQEISNKTGSGGEKIKK